MRSRREAGPTASSPIVQSGLVSGLTRSTQHICALKRSGQRPHAGTAARTRRGRSRDATGSPRRPPSSLPGEHSGETEAAAAHTGLRVKVRGRALRHSPQVETEPRARRRVTGPPNCNAPHDGAGLSPRTGRALHSLQCGRTRNSTKRGTSDTDGRLQGRSRTGDSWAQKADSRLSGAVGGGAAHSNVVPFVADGNVLESGSRMLAQLWETTELSA